MCQALHLTYTKSIEYVQILWITEKMHSVVFVAHSRTTITKCCHHKVGVLVGLRGQTKWCAGTTGWRRVVSHFTPRGPSVSAALLSYATISAPPYPDGFHLLNHCGIGLYFALEDIKISTKEIARHIDHGEDSISYLVVWECIRHR